MRTHLESSSPKYRFLLSVLLLSQSLPFKLRRGVAPLVTAKPRTFPLAGIVRAAICHPYL